MTESDADIQLKQVKELPPPLSDNDRKKSARVMLAIYDRLEVVAHNVKIALDVSASAHEKACIVEKKQNITESFVKGIIWTGSSLIALLTTAVIFKK
jgi:hypothetical protein